MAHRVSGADWWTEEFRRNPRYHPGEEYAFFGTGILTGGSSILGAAPAGVFDTGAVAAANHMAEQVESSADIFNKNGVPYWGRPQILRVQMHPNTTGVAFCRSGIELGSFLVAPPFPNPKAGENIIQLYARFDPAGGNDQWQLLINTTAGATSQATYTITSVAPPLLGTSYDLMIEYVPNGYVRAWIDAVLALEVSGALSIPNPLNNGQLYGGVFVSTEAAASRMVSSFGQMETQTIGMP